MTRRDQLIEVIATAVKNRRIKHPVTAAGTKEDEIYESDETSIAVAHAVLVALDEQGYEITEKS